MGNSIMPETILTDTKILIIIEDQPTGNSDIYWNYDDNDVDLVLVCVLSENKFIVKNQNYSSDKPYTYAASLLIKSSITHKVIYNHDTLKIEYIPYNNTYSRNIMNKLISHFNNVNQLTMLHESVVVLDN